MQPTPQQRHLIEKQREMAAARFPDEWAKTLTMPGFDRRKRQKALRDAAVEAAGQDRVRAKGGSCANCMHLLCNPSSLRGLFCDLDSDFHGYAQTTSDAVCSRWQPDEATQ